MPYQLTYPGQKLKEWLLENGKSQQQAAEEVDMPYKDLREICNGTAKITKYAANKLGALTGIAPDVWLAMDKNYRESRGIESE